MKKISNLHKQIKKKLDYFIKKGKIPNLLFYGPQGSGKKTILKYLIGKIYEPIYLDKSDEKSNEKNKEKYVMYVNCAYGKGIKFIRDELKFFAKTNINLTLKSSSRDFSIPKSIILLNAEQLTIDAQSALRRCIELFSLNTRFFIVTKDKDKLLKPIISRFCEIYVPQPILPCGSIINMHNLQHHKYQSNYLSLKENILQEVFKELVKDNINLFTISNNIYEKGISGLDIIEYIDNSNEEINDGLTKYILLIHYENARREIRDEVLLICHILTLYKMRHIVTLENIYTM
jgi:DNA polymerase III delta prime subunit